MEPEESPCRGRSLINHPEASEIQGPNELALDPEAAMQANEERVEESGLWNHPPIHPH